MAASLDELLPSASDRRKKLAEVEAEKAPEDAQKSVAMDAAKKELLDQFSKPSGESDDERLKRVAVIIKRALDNGLTEVLVGRFPNELCTDGGRAINQAEAGWEKTLTGLPKDLHEFWKSHLKPRGYQIRSEIVDFPNGIPGDIGLILS